MAEQRVTDEQLTELAVSRRCDGLVLLLIADVRASRAREAEARAKASEYFERGLEYVREADLVAAERDEMRANWRSAVATEAATATERDGLQQRIDEALAIYGNAASTGNRVAAMVAAQPGTDTAGG